MPRANLTLTIPEGVWIGDVSRAHPTATFRILAALARDETPDTVYPAAMRDEPPRFPLGRWRRLLLRPAYTAAELFDL